MPPASMRASDSCCSRSRSAAGSPSSGPEALISQQQPVQGRPRLGAALGLGAQGLALDGDSADLTLAKALDAIVLDGELVADPGARGAELDEHLAHALLAATEQAAAAPLDARASGKRLLELGCQHLDRGQEIGAVAAQTGRHQIEGVLGAHPIQATWRRRDWPRRTTGQPLEDPPRAGGSSVRE